MPKPQDKQPDVTPVTPPAESALEYGIRMRNEARKAQNWRRQRPAPIGPGTEPPK